MERLQTNGERPSWAVFTVLLVGSDERLQSYVKRLLDHDRSLMTLPFVATMERGIHVTKAVKPSIILFDLEMDKAGVNSIRAFRAACPQSAVIAVSMRAEGAFREQALLLGADRFLQKDQMGEGLADVVREAVDVHRMRLNSGLREKRA